jgi:RimJ/RimL family protein N-acetyltransferase
MQIETERLVLRSSQSFDAQALAEIWSDPEVTLYMGGPRDFAETRELFEEEALSGAETHIDLWPVIEKTSGQVIGHCGLIDKDVDGQSEYELVYVFHTSAWGKGYATEAASAVRDYAFEQLDLKRIIALIDPENAASERVAKKIGMHFERKTCRPNGKVLRVYARHAYVTSEAAYR